MKLPLLSTLLLSLCAGATPIVGHLASPTGALPALHVYAWSANGHLVATATAPGQPTFRMDLPPGRYRLFATPADPGVPLVYAGYTRCQPGDDASACSNHDLRWLQVADDGPVAVDLNDWHIDDAQAQLLDRALHRTDGAGDQDPSRAGPRFFEYPATPLRRAHATKLVGDDVRPAERARLAEALTSGHINFAGRAAVVQLPCGSGCLAARIVDLETGRVTPVPTGPERQGLLACPERLAYRRDSRLLRIGFEVSGGGSSESFYLWDPDSGRLKPIGAPMAPVSPGHCVAAHAGL